MISVRELQGMDDILKDMQRLEGQLPKRDLADFPIRTPEEIENEEKMVRYALRLGINLCSTNDQEPDFDEDKEMAFLYIMKGEKVPEELEKKLIQREQDRIAREGMKTKKKEA